MAENMETRISSEQAKEAIYQAHLSKDAISKIAGLQSDATKIDGSVSRRQTVLPKNLLRTGSSLLDVSTISGVTADVGTLSLNSTINPFASTSLNIVSASAGANVAMRKSLSGLSLINIETFSIFVKFLNYAAFSQLSVRFGSGLYASYKFATCSLKNKVKAKANEWNNVAFDSSEFTMSGGMTLTDEITYIQIHGQANSGQIINLDVAGVYSNLISRPAIAFSFDDGNMSDYLTCYPVLKAKGWSATSYIITDDIGLVVNNGTEPRLTLAQMNEMYADGWTFGIHGKNSNNWTSTSLAVTETSIKTCRDYLYAHGFTNCLNHCAYPENQYNDDIIAILKRYGIVYARTTNEFPFLSPAADFMKINLGFHMKATLQENIDLLESRIKLGGLVNVYAHPIYEGRTLTPEVFEQFVDYIDANYRRYVTTIPQWCKDYESGTII